MYLVFGLYVCMYVCMYVCISKLGTIVVLFPMM